MEYTIYEAFAGGRSCPSSKEAFDLAKASRDVIVATSDIEESFSLAARSYIDIEKGILDATLEWHLEGNYHYQGSEYFDKWREVFNLKVLSLLMSGTAYVEKLCSLSKSNVIPGLTWDAFNPHRTSVYDSSIHYRVMCALRNFSVHNQLPISGIPLLSKNQREPDSAEEKLWRRRVTCSPYIQTEPLINSGINKRMREEISSLNATGIDLKMFMRGYVEGLFNLHEAVRRLTEDSIELSLNDLSNLENQLAAEDGEPAKFAHISGPNDGHQISLYIDTSKLSYIRDRRTRWKKLTGLRSSYVSSETTLNDSVSHGDTEGILIIR